MNSNSRNVPGVHVEVYRILDDALGQPIPSPGWRGGIHAVIDELRSAKGSVEAIAMAEAISLHLHQLEWARRNGNLASEQVAREALKGAATDWLGFRVLN